MDKPTDTAIRFLRRMNDWEMVACDKPLERCFLEALLLDFIELKRSSSSGVPVFVLSNEGREFVMANGGFVDYWAEEDTRRSPKDRPDA